MISDFQLLGGDYLGRELLREHHGCDSVGKIEKKASSVIRQRLPKQELQLEQHGCGKLVEKIVVGR